MKPTFTCLAFLLSLGLSALNANPEVPRAVAQSFGTAVSDGILLIKGSGTTAEPVVWTVYSRDAFRPQDVLRVTVKQEAAGWKAEASGAGGNVLERVPPRPVDFTRLRYRSADARVAAAKASALAQSTFVSIDYQLAANGTTGVPEWGLALKDDTGYEVGFVVVSGETGAVTFQDWTPRVPSNITSAEGEGERAAKTVKRTARKAWNWTDNARKETRGFFRELFR